MLHRGPWILVYDPPSSLKVVVGWPTEEGSSGPRDDEVDAPRLTLQVANSRTDEQSALHYDFIYRTQLPFWDIRVVCFFTPDTCFSYWLADHTPTAPLRLERSMLMKKVDFHCDTRILQLEEI